MSTGPEKEIEFDELEEQVGVPSGRPASEKLAHPTVKERAARGKDARTKCPRTSFAELDPPKRDPVALLEAQAPSRVPELVPIRYGRMLVSPFAFFRGGAAIMAHDIASAPRTDLAAQLCGDAHLANFGGFASPERDLVFDLNDFDETLAGPFEWDLKRLAASFEVAGRDRNFSDAERREAVLNTVGSYRLAMRQFAEMSNMDVWYAHASAADLEERIRASRRHDPAEDLHAGRRRRRGRATA